VREDKELSRRNLESQLQDFIKNGGRIEKIKTGVSSKNALKSRGHSSTWSQFFPPNGPVSANGGAEAAVNETKG
tara:strand:+ start:2435 stop:2656 length:222 start_codon:yes stop_codon:yes gene_type:complete